MQIFHAGASCREEEGRETGKRGKEPDKCVPFDIESFLAAVCRFSRIHDLCQCPFYRAVRLVEKLDGPQKSGEGSGWESISGDYGDGDEEDRVFDIRQLLMEICRFSRAHDLCRCPYYKETGAESEPQGILMRDEDMPF